MGNHLSKTLISLRKSKKLSQAGLGIALGVSRSQVSNWEMGRRIPSLEDAIRIANYFQITVDSLVYPEKGIK